MFTLEEKAELAKIGAVFPKQRDKRKAVSKGAWRPGQSVAA